MVMDWRYRTILAVLIAILICSVPSPAQEPAGANYDALVALYQEIRADGRPAVVNGIPDYRPAAIGEREQKIPDFRRRLYAIDPSGWPVSERVDWLVVQAALNGLEFQLRIQHPWSSDPGFYADQVQRLAYTNLPVPADKLADFQTQLNTIPALLSQAESNLSHGAREFAKLALRDMTKADGVEENWPARPVPPAGTIGWYEDLLERARQQQPELVPAAEKALAAVKEYDSWLIQHSPQMTAPVGVGEPDFNWYMKYVRYLPYNMEDSVKIGNMEYERAMAFLALQRHADRNLPEIALPTSKEEYDARMKDALDTVRQFILKNDILTMPPYTMGPLHQEVPWTVRPGGKQNFWEAIQFRDPIPDVLHATLPGHAFDLLVHRHDTRPIRGTYTDGARIEGWAFYLEEGFMQDGLLDNRPRTKELIYIFMAARGVRDPAEAMLQTNRWTVDRAVQYMVGKVPYMEDNVARVDCSIYLRQPTYGGGYQLGKMEMIRLIGDREHQLGDKFNLKEFYDQFLAEGPIPMALIRWEMTGLDDQIKGLWRTPEIPSLAENGR
jgi:hypothetical protein